MRALATAALAVLLLAGRTASAQEDPFEPTGEVRFHGWGSVGSGASFDANRLVGPGVNLTRREDGTWAGDLVGQNVDLHLDGPNRLVGPNVRIEFTQRGGTTRVEGLFFGQRVRVEMNRRKFQGRLGTCSVDLARKGPQYFTGDVGCFENTQAGVARAGKASLTLIGEAANETPPLPQLALALIAILPG